MSNSYVMLSTLQKSSLTDGGVLLVLESDISEMLTP